MLKKQSRNIRVNTWAMLQQLEGGFFRAHFDYLIFFPFWTSGIYLSSLQGPKQLSSDGTSLLLWWSCHKHWSIPSLVTWCTSVNRVLQAHAGLHTLKSRAVLTCLELKTCFNISRTRACLLPVGNCTLPEAFAPVRLWKSVPLSLAELNCSSLPVAILQVLTAGCLFWLVPVLLFHTPLLLPLQLICVMIQKRLTQR